MKKHLLNTFLILFGVLLGIFLAEFAVQIFLPQNRMVTWLEMHPKGFMMNQSGGTAFQEFEERTTHYRFTKSRLRGADSSTSVKTTLALGDSFTFGLLLEEEDTYVHHLQNKIDGSELDSLQILNGGVGGAGLADWPTWLETFGPDIQPDVVLYFLNTQDIDRALSKNIYLLKEDSLQKTQRWKPREFITQLNQKHWYRWLQAHSDLANLIVKVLWKNLYFEDLTNNFDPETSSVPIPGNDDLLLASKYSLNLSTSILKKMNNWCHKNDCVFIITSTGFFDHKLEPNHTTRFYNDLKKTKNSTLPNQRFFDNSACIDTMTDGNIEQLRIPKDSHPNEAGAKIIADCTWQWLEPELKKIF